MILRFSLLQASHFTSGFYFLEPIQSQNLHIVQIGNVRCARQERLALIGYQNFVKTRQFLIKHWQPPLCFFHDLLNNVKFNRF